ncbi:sulfite exporter TauE/SafE family protein [Akkermansiaceae bacterium]|nr:sulfite exporter TauE/SafE family protein [Akkermansiaceae bacterium]
MNPLVISGALAIGLSLGLTGAGGSILTVPVLVYLAGLPPDEAVGVSLFVVGAAALVGALQRWRSGDFHPQAALIFGGAGMLGAAAGARFTPLVPGAVLMGLFAILMIVVAIGMLLGKDGQVAPLPECKPARCLLAGGATGVLTGFVGVGGGFVLVPAMMRFARLPLPMAAGTSLAVIAANSISGGISHLPSVAGHWPLAAMFAAFAAAGVLLGKRLSEKLPARAMRQGFAVMVLLAGGFVLYRSLAG